MQLYFIRHGQSENNLLWVQTGSSEGRSEDPPLSPAGQNQARSLARFLRGSAQLAGASIPSYDPQNIRGLAITHLYCSLMLRSVETGAEIARALDLPLVAWEDLHESGGIHCTDTQTGERIGLPGKNRAYFEANHPDLRLPESLGEEGWWNRPYEEPEQRPIRARRFLSSLHERHGNLDDRVVVVSHGGFYSHLLRAILDLPESRKLWFSLNNAAITRIDFHGEETVLSYMNRVDFLPQELVT
jgi:2,3-bisphosphoglycerate-dependent phosphoglycerate mutase